MTEKLYETDSHLCRFEAKVLECIESKIGFAAVLDKTAFFPEGGGQSPDTGNLGGARVFDVQIKDGIIYHYTDKPLKIGADVCGQIDFARRFAFMQNHTGEHIVSGIAHKLFDLNNVGFHLGEEFVTVDFDRELTREQLNEIEYIANQKVWQNLPVKTYYPTEEQLKNTDYRSKKQINGAVRLVEIKDTDICACCAPHVNNTGEIGVIKLLDFERMRGGVRIILKCGAFALNDYRVKYENILNISNRLSSKQENAASAVEILEEKFTAEKLQNSELKKRFADFAVSANGKDKKCIFLNDCDIKDLQLISDKLHRLYGGIRGAFSGNSENYAFAICGEERELNEFFKKFKSELSVRGGGRNGMVQGTVNADADKIKLYF